MAKMTLRDGRESSRLASSKKALAAPVPLRCAFCNKKKPSLAVKHADQYCSRVCCEKANGTFDSNRRYDHTLKQLQWPAAWKHGSNVLRDGFVTRKEALAMLTADVLDAAVKAHQIQKQVLRNHAEVYSRKGIQKLAEALQEL